MKTITIHEDACVKNIRALHAEIREFLGNESDITIDLGSLRGIDCSIAQVLIAAGISAGKSGKTLKIKSASERVKMRLSLCGVMK
jgi:anti-anti-sigma regulatory factor